MTTFLNSYVILQPDRHLSVESLNKPRNEQSLAFIKRYSTDSVTKFQSLYGLPKHPYVDKLNNHNREKSDKEASLAHSLDNDILGLSFKFYKGHFLYLYIYNIQVILI
jgi:hypothetical protein